MSVQRPKTLTTWGILSFVWSSSGGWRALVRSFDFYVTLFIWILAAPFWLEPKWPDQVISALPNLLGFTLGGFAIFLGFGNDDFIKAIANSDEKNSPYLSVSSAFMLFVSFQVASLLWAIAASALFSWPIPEILYPFESLIQVGAKVLSGIGYYIFIYTIALLLRASIRIFRLSRWYNAYLTRIQKGGNRQVARPLRGLNARKRAAKVSRPTKPL